MPIFGKCMYTTQIRIHVYIYIYIVYTYNVFDQAAMQRCGMWQLAAATLQQNGCQLTRFDFYNPRAACNAVKTNDKLESIKLQLQLQEKGCLARGCLESRGVEEGA